jgi:hypothetical protein
MRLVDFCNPHFKDEHPSLEWIPASWTVEQFHATRLASPGLPDTAEAAVDHHRNIGAEALTLLVTRQRTEQNSLQHRVKTGSTTSP